MTIYLDAIWILNLLLDMLLLLLTKNIAKDQTGLLRIAFGAVIASLIVPLTIFYPESILTTVVGKVMYSILIVFCTFRWYSIYRFVTLWLLFYFMTFAVGGGLTALYSLMSTPFTVTGAGVMTMGSGYGDPVSWLFILIAFPIVLIFTKKRMDNHAKEKVRYDSLYQIDLKVNEETYSTNGYIDSGNHLIDPITKWPVVICDEVFMRNWFTEQEWHVLKNVHESLDFEQVPCNWKDKIQIIPYQSVVGTSQFMFAIRPDQLVIHYGDGDKIEEIIIRKVLIGIQFSTLSRDLNYHCLLQPSLIKLGLRNTA